MIWTTMDDNYDIDDNMIWQQNYDDDMDDMDN